MTTETLFADVIVPLGVPNKYTYRVPAAFAGAVIPGKRVLVQFGRSRLYTGIVHHVHTEPPVAYQAKYIEEVLDDVPVVNATQLKFWDWVAFYYYAHPGDVMNAALPSGLKLSSKSVVQLSSTFNFEEGDPEFFTPRERKAIDALLDGGRMTFDALSRALSVKSVHAVVSGLHKKGAVDVFEDVEEKYKPRLQPYVRITADYMLSSAREELLRSLEKKAFRQAEVMLAFMRAEKSDTLVDGWMAKSELAKHCEAAAISQLVKKGVLEEQKFETGRLLNSASKQREVKLSVAQLKAYESVKHAFDETRPVVLQGVTGSGKTEIYMTLIRETLDAGRQALLLVPEIALTTQLIGRLRAYFGDEVGVYHSRFSENERVEIWKSVLESNGENSPAAGRPAYRVILGPRSALFLPFDDLGLVIVDEEHDASYKQHDPAPRYHARDSALYLASLHKAHVILGSATPSVESHYNCTIEKFARVVLPVQYVSGGGTEAEVCDLNYYQTSGQMRASLTPPLFAAIEKALSKKKQVILFQNRRGFAPYTECSKCGHVPHCVQCDVSLIYHKHQHRLVCHYCGYSTAPEQACAACGNPQMQYKGLGTQRVEEDIALLFPDAKTARMDLDTTRSKHAYAELIEQFESGQIDILIGTQMVTKGLDFANVTVVGIMNADAMLNFPDFRSFERAFQVITQVRGRAGRSDEIGKVFIQTTRTTHPVIRMALEKDIDGFFDNTLAERRQFSYPPFSRLISLVAVSGDLNEVNHLADALAKHLNGHFAGHVLGPEFPVVSKIRNRYHKRILVKCPREQPLTQARQSIHASLALLYDEFRKWDYRVNVDVDPV